MSGIIATYVSAASFTVAGDVSEEFATGTRVRADCGTDGVVIGTVTTVTYSFPDTLVAMSMDGAGLTENLASVRHGNDVPISLCNHAAQHAAGGRDPIATASTAAAGVVQLATDIQALEMTAQLRAITPSNVAALRASQVESEAGVANRKLMTPERTFQAIAAKAATTSARGSVELATDAEAQGLESEAVVLTPSNVAALLASEAEAEEGTADDRIMTPLGTRQAILATVPGDIGAVPSSRTISTTAPLGGGGDFTANRTLTVSAASTTATGVVELATSTEAVTGTDTSLVPPVSAHRQAFLSWLRDTVGEFPGLIPPAYNLFAPNLALPGTTTFSRASTGWDVSQAPAVKTYTTNLPRWSYDAAGNLLGLRIEGAATRINTIAAAPTAPENVTVTAVAHTISFYGTGSVVLSGAHAATVNGAGALPARVSYTFTPTAGTLVLTPSGTVQHLQVEAGSLPTSPILGEGSAVARAADVATVALSGIDFNAAEGTIYCEFRVAGVSVQQRIFYVDDGTYNNALSLFVSAGNKITMAVASGGTTVVYTEASSTVVANTVYKVAFSFRNNNYQLVVNGGPAVSDTSGAMPSSLVTIRLGQGLGGVQPIYGALHHFAYFPRALTTAQLQAMTL